MYEQFIRLEFIMDFIVFSWIVYQLHYFQEEQQMDLVDIFGPDHFVLRISLELKDIAQAIIL
jgi:hypothetical protein